jgi:hypothetical protein
VAGRGPIRKRSDASGRSDIPRPATRDPTGFHRPTLPSLPGCRLHADANRSRASGNCDESRLRALGLRGNSPSQTPLTKSPSGVDRGRLRCLLTSSLARAEGRQIRQERALRLQWRECPQAGCGTDPSNYSACARTPGTAGPVDEAGGSARLPPPAVLALAAPGCQEHPRCER